MVYWQSGNYTILQGDSLDLLAGMEPCRFTSVITDPPAGINFMGKKWDNLTGYIPCTERGQAVAAALSDMLDGWMLGFLAFTVDWAFLALPLVKPGGSALVWALPRTSDLTQFGLRLAGWRIIDCIAFLFGSGFPKSHDISKAIDKAAGAEREVVGKHPAPCNNVDATVALGGAFQESPNITAPATDSAKLWDGWGTALKPAREDWILCYRPREGTYAENALKHGVAGLWIDGGRVETNGDTTNERKCIRVMGVGIPDSRGAGVQHGFNYHKQGRWPSNVLHDGNEEVLELFPETGLPCGSKKKTTHKTGMFGIGQPGKIYTTDDNGNNSAARFFYCAKASRSERNEGLEDIEPTTTDDGRNIPIDNPFQRGKTLRQNKHPTVKSLELMKYLVKLTKTPTGGQVLDPFGGSGTTMLACILEGRPCTLIERDAEYCEIAKRRSLHWLKQTRQMELELH